jgi:hypothetical protein
LTQGNLSLAGQGQPLGSAVVFAIAKLWRVAAGVLIPPNAGRSKPPTGKPLFGIGCGLAFAQGPRWWWR